jgi:LysR family glycine cleavage system transcriptional activator
VKLAHLNGLRAFEATLRGGNFRAAAAELGVTPAAVGQQVRALEDYLGRKLFVRSSTGVVPTPQAKAIAADLTASLFALSDILAQLEKVKPNRRLALTTTPSFIDYWLAQRLAQFHGLNTGADVRIDATQRVVDLLSEDFDFAIRYVPPQSEIYDDVLLFDEWIMPVCTPDFASRYNLVKHPKSLAGVPLFHLVEMSTDPSALDWEGWCKKHGLDQSGTTEGLRFSQLQSGLQAAKAGLGLALCGLVESYKSLRDGSLVMPFAPEYNRRTKYEYHLVRVRGRRMTKVHRQFRDWIVAAAAEFRVAASALLAGREAVSPRPDAPPT